MKLVEQELWQRGVRVPDSAEAMAVGSVLSPGVGTELGDRSSKSQVGASDKTDEKNQQEAIHWHTRGVAARALHLSRGVEKPSGRITYSVVLKGLVQELSTRGTYYTAPISPLGI